MPHQRLARLVLEVSAFGLAMVAFSVSAAQSFVADYGPTKSEKYEVVQDKLRQAKFLEAIAGDLSAGIDIQDQLILGTMECGKESAFYLPQQKAIVLCLEFITQLTQGINQDFATIATPDEIDKAIGGAIYFTLMHEVGHMLINRFQLPVLGREEDAADQIGAFFLLHDKRAQQTLPGALWLFRENTKSYSRIQFSDEHSLGPQRQSNLACWAYGKNPTQFDYLITDGYLLTKERAVRCSNEYEQINSSVRRLFEGKIQLPPL